MYERCEPIGARETRRYVPCERDVNLFEHLQPPLNALSAKADTGAINYTSTGGVTPTLGKEGVATAFYGNPRQVFGTFSLKF